MHFVAERSVTEPSALYDQDFFAWTIQQSEALKSCGNLVGVDTLHLIEELESMGKSQLRALVSALEQTLVHLIKLSYSPATDPRNGWAESVRKQRHDMDVLLEESPSLRPKLLERFDAAWAYARKEATLQLVAHDETPALPFDCPFTLQQILDESFMPLKPIGNSQRQH